jgi:hypothetical protein
VGGIRRNRARDIGEWESGDNGHMFVGIDLHKSTFNAAVVDGERRPIGIVTEDDVEYARRRGLEDASAWMVMQEDPLTVRARTSPSSRRSGGWRRPGRDACRSSTSAAGSWACWQGRPSASPGPLSSPPWREPLTQCEP